MGCPPSPRYSLTSSNSRTPHSALVNSTSRRFSAAPSPHRDYGNVILLAKGPGCFGDRCVQLGRDLAGALESEELPPLVLPFDDSIRVKG